MNPPCLPPPTGPLCGRGSPIQARTRAKAAEARRRAVETINNAPPRFHASVQNRESIIQQFREHPTLFIEVRAITATLKKIFNILQLRSIDDKMDDMKCYASLQDINKTYHFVFLRAGYWWRLHCRRGQKTVAWHRQSILTASNGYAELVDDPISHTTSKATDHVIGFAVRSTASKFRIAKLFFDLRNLRDYDFAGNRQNNSIIGDTQVGRLRRSVDGNVSSTTEQTSAEDGSEDTPDGTTQTDPTYEQARQAVLTLAAHATTDSAEPEVTPSPMNEGDDPQENENPALQLSSSTSQTQPPPPIPPSTSPQPPSQQQISAIQTDAVETPPEDVDGLQLIMKTAQTQAQERNKTQKGPGPFHRPSGLVPRILYGTRGRKLVKILHQAIGRSGNEALRTWLNAPHAFQQQRREDQDPPRTSEERNKRLSLRKFTYGDVGASFRLLKNEVQPKISPSEEEITSLFPLAENNEPLPSISNAKQIVLSPEHIGNIVADTPRNRASGPSQLSYDHIRYAINHEHDLLEALTDVLSFIANNPDKAEDACFEADAFFIRKPNGKPRPIVLQETLTKILNKALNMRLVNHITQSGSLKDQYCIGYRNSTTGAALKVQRYLSKQGTRYAISIDFTNAFNTINRRPIIEEMERLKVTKGITRYISTYLTRFTLRHDGRSIQTHRGVPQGCPLSMTLFALGTAALLRGAKERGAKVVAYADDIVIMGDNPTGLIETFKHLKEQATKMGLEINENKTAYFTTAENDEGKFHSLQKETWKYLGIPISTNAWKVQQGVETFLKSVEEDTQVAWRAPLLHQAYFCFRTCVQTRAVHILRGTAMQDTTFLREWQERFNKALPDAIKAVPVAYRIQPVTAGGLGLTDLQTLQTAARQGLLIDEDAPEASPNIRDKVGNSMQGKSTQAEITSMQNKFALEEHDATANFLQDRRTIGLNAPHRTDSSWLASPPKNPAQVLTDTAFRIAILQRYGIDGIAEMHEKCPCCHGAPLTLAHALNCKPANSGTHIHRHNTIVRMIGAHLATRGIVAKYEQKPAFRSKKTPHIPDITYVNDSIPHHIDVTIFAAYGPNKDMQQTGLANKCRQYTKTWGTQYRDVHIVAFDNAARPAKNTYEFLHNLGISNALYRTMQFVILQANARCYENVMQRLAEQKNMVQTRHQAYMMVPSHLLEDIVKEKN